MKTLANIALILEDAPMQQTDEFIDGFNPLELEAFKYAPVTSCDVERSFSSYKRSWKIVGDHLFSRTSKITL